MGWFTDDKPSQSQSAKQRAKDMRETAAQLEQIAQHQREIEKIRERSRKPKWYEW